MMGVSVDVYVWPQLALAPGATVTFIHSIVDGNGQSLIVPERWFWMSAVPDHPWVRPDHPTPPASLEIVVQGPVRARDIQPGPTNTHWHATWRNPEPTTSVLVRPQLLAAPAL